MDNKNFLINYPLEYSLPLKECKALKKVLKIANESYVVHHTENIDVKVGRLQYYKFEIYIPTKNFAQGYAHIGMLYAQHVLPIWNKRYKKNNIAFNQNPL